MIPGLGRFPGEGNGNPLQVSCLENPMDRGAWQATVYGVTRVRHNLASKPPPWELLMHWLKLVIITNLSYFPLAQMAKYLFFKGKK